jgi:uncharacterized membrane protein YgdD (TMEM256/DUF423 family)
MNVYKIISAIFLALAVLLGAFGAHAWAEALSGHEATFETANKYHFLHGLGILILALYHENTPSIWLTRSIQIMTLGILCFSGSLYLLSFPDTTGAELRSVLGPVTPIGGLLLISAWVLTIIHFLRKN